MRIDQLGTVCGMAAILLVPAVAPADAQMPGLDALLADAAAYDARCRGGSGDDPETWQACGARDYIYWLLGTQGLCYGKEGQAGFEMRWHLCEAGSYVSDRP